MSNFADELILLLEQFVDCRDEAKCIDDAVPDSSYRAWKALGARLDRLEADARAAIATFEANRRQAKEQQ